MCPMETNSSETWKESSFSFAFVVSYRNIGAKKVMMLDFVLQGHTKLWSMRH